MEAPSDSPAFFFEPFVNEKGKFRIWLVYTGGKQIRKYKIDAEQLVLREFESLIYAMEQGREYYMRWHCRHTYLKLESGTDGMTSIGIHDNSLSAIRLSLDLGCAMFIGARENSKRCVGMFRKLLRTIATERYERMSKRWRDK